MNAVMVPMVKKLQSTRFKKSENINLNLAISNCSSQLVRVSILT